MATRTLLMRPLAVSASRSTLRLTKPSPFPRRVMSVHTIGVRRAAAVGAVLVAKARFDGGFGLKAEDLMMGGGGRRRFSAGATHVNDPGSIDSPLMQSMEKKIKEELNAEQVTVKDAYGDGRHVSIDVISSSFEGQSAVNRQRMVYKAIWEELQNTVHAVDQMTTRTPSEAGQK
uniref:Uncharacterized protein n=1 Tax=Kalanchoe fedtschenkoi TaxID=63787 RepID=A0A7N0U370_KALFE